MTEKYENVICRLKTIRQSKKLSQSQLADLVGIKRQAVYDIESGKYTPNTLLALKMAKELGCKVEDLFYEQPSEEEHPVTLIENTDNKNSRISVAKVRGKFIGYPLTGKFLFNEGFKPADGLFNADTCAVKLFNSEKTFDSSVMLFGCDPAFSILSEHVSSISPNIKIHCRFASSKRAIEGLSAGMAHIAGTHLHNKGPGEANVAMVKEFLNGSKATIVAFSLMEEGLMVAPGNPCNIKGVKELGNGDIRLVNREPGAGLRTLLDNYISHLKIPKKSITGYKNEVANHLEGAQMVAFNFADAALGIRAIADACGLDFVPIEEVRCDIVVPNDLLDHTGIRVILDVLQTRRLRDDLSAIPGYAASRTGSVIAEV